MFGSSGIRINIQNELSIRYKILTEKKRFKLNQESRIKYMKRTFID